MTVRSELNHESLNTTHSPSLMRVVVEQPASAMIATTSRIFILAPSPCLDVPRASGALPRQWTSLYHQARGVPSGNATGHLVPRVARIKPGPVMTHFARPSRRPGPKSAVPGCSSGRRGLSGNTRHLPRCDAGYRGSVRERSYCAAFFMGGCPRDGVAYQ